MENIFNELFESFGNFAIFIIVLRILVFIMPLIIAVDVNRMRHENKELKNELSEIKNLLILQNELLRNQQPNYNQYYQQQPYNQNYQQQSYNNNSNSNSNYTQS